MTSRAFQWLLTPPLWLFNLSGSKQCGGMEVGNLEAECGLLMMIWWIAHFSTWSNTFPREDLCKYFTEWAWGAPGFLGSFRARGEGLDGIQAQSSGNQDCIQLGKWVHLQWHPTPVLLPGKSHGQRSLVGSKSMGLLRVGHDWVTSLSLFTFMHWRRKWQPTPVFLPGESQGRGSLVGCHLWGRTESDMTKVT